MQSTQEFLIIESQDSIAVYGVGKLPAGTVVHGDARRLRVVGQTPVQPPQSRLSASEWEHWQNELMRAGYTTTVEPFWR